MTNAPKNRELLECARRIQKHKPPIQVDVLVENHGSIFLFRPLTDVATQWIEEHVSAEGYHPNWPTLVVEPRYASDLAKGMQLAGLVVR